MRRATESEGEVLGTPEIARRCGAWRSTVRRWMLEGVTISGEVVQLPHFYAGRRLKAKAADVDAFLARCNEDGGETMVAPAPTVHRQRAEAKRQQEALRKRLAPKPRGKKAR